MEYGSLREKIATEKADRSARYDGFRDLLDRANRAGFAAGEAMTPRPMIVSGADPLTGVIDISKPSYYVPDGMCGFAWVHISKGNTSFAKWLVKQGLARKSYYGGLDIWVSAHNQSIERKEAHARAMAQVLKDGGIECYADSRLD